MRPESIHKTAQTVHLETPVSSAPVGDAGPHPVVTPPATGRPGPAEQPNSAAAVEPGPGTAGSTITAGPVLTFIAHGTPKPKGSLKHVGGGRLREQVDGATWHDTIIWAVVSAMPSPDPVTGPLRVEATFSFAKPATAPKRRRVWPITRSSGDLDKQLRRLFDAMQAGGAFRDDSQIVEVTAAKRFCNEGPDALHFPGVVVRIYLVDDTGEEGSR